MSDVISRREALAKMIGMAAGGVVAASLGGACEGSSCGEVGKRSCEPRSSAGLRCLPIISGPLWSIGGAESLDMDEDGWRDELDEQRRIGFDLLWLINTASAVERPGDPLRSLLDLCAKRKVQVILDTGWSSASWWKIRDLSGEIEISAKHTKLLWQRYGGHPAFWGWYIPQESYMPSRNPVTDLYARVVYACKKTSNLPVTISPYFVLNENNTLGDYTRPTPDEYKHAWTDCIKQSGVDIVMLQDSGEHYSFYTIDDRIPYFEAMSGACRDAGARLWGNVESAERDCRGFEDYRRLYGHEPKAAPWRLVPMERMQAKLRLAARYSERIVNWGYHQFCRPDLSPEAKSWCEQYRQYYRSVRPI